MKSLDELLGHYFDAAFVQDDSTRTNDASDVVAQKALSAIRQAAKDAVAAEAEACAQLLELKRADLLLLGGEMSAQELRTTMAVLTNRAAVIRRRHCA